MKSLGALLGAIALGSLAGCGGEPDSPATERTVAGDTTTLRFRGAAPREATLVEEVRIGVLEGAQEYQFGRVSDIAVDQEDGIYVFDGLAPALRYYSSDGEYVRTLGSEGEGPGEYQDASLGMVVRRTDGRLVMRDPRNMRLNVYNPDGSTSETWRVESGLFTSGATTLGPGDHLYLKTLAGPPEPNKPWPIALLHMDDRGQLVDTVTPPTLPNEPDGLVGTFSVSKVWSMSPVGGFVAGVNDRYALAHYRTDGTVLRIEREMPLPTVHPGERAELEDMNAWRVRTQGQFMTSELPPVPETKPAYRSIVVGEHGRIWVRRYVEAEQGESVQRQGPPGMEPPPPTRWREPAVMDVFEPDGEFIGEVRLPPRTELSVLRYDRVWGIQRGEYDEAYVVGFRLEWR